MGDTGGSFENAYLYPAGDPRLLNINRINQKSIEYKTLYESLLECVRDNPNGYHGTETFDPPTPWTSDIHYRITQELKLENWRDLRVFPALKTAADRYHGIDLFFSYHDERTKKDVIVTVDLTVNPDKTKHKADVIVSDRGVYVPEHDIAFEFDEQDHSTDEEEKYRREVLRRETAKAIADLIKDKLTDTRGVTTYADIATRLNIQSLLEGQSSKIR